MRGFYTFKADGQYSRDSLIFVMRMGPDIGRRENLGGRRKQLTFAVFLVAPALLWGKGAGVAFLPCLGGCH